MAEDNPYAQFAQEAQPAPEQNPYAQFIQSKPDQSGGFWNAMVAGWQGSATGLMKRGRLPDVVLDQSHAKWYEKLASMATQTASDVPEMIAGSIAGGVAGTAVAPGIGTVLGGGAGAFAVPTAIRESLIQAYSKGHVTSASDFLSRASIVLQQTGKDAIVGAATAGVGKLVAPLGSLAKSGAEVTTMTTANAALEGKLPDAQDFVNAAILVGGMHTAGHMAGKIANIYAKTGVPPEQVLADSHQDPQLKQELATGSAEDIPKAYAPIAAADEAKNAFNADKAQQVLESPYADIPDAKLPYQVNLKYISGPDGLQQLVTRMSDVYKDEINAQRGGQQTHADTELKATQMLNDMTGGLADKIVTGRQPGTAANAVELKVRGDLMMQASVEAGAAIKAYNEAREAGTSTEQMRMDAIEAIHRSAMVQAEFTGAASEVGRALEYLKRVKELRDQGDRMQKLLDLYGGNPDEMLKMAGDIDTPEGMARFARDMNKATTYEKVVEAWKAGILSGPVTHIANIIGNGTFTAMRPLVDATASMLGGITGGERVHAAEPFARVFGNLEGAKDAIRIAGKAIQSAYEEGGLRGAAEQVVVGKADTAKAEQFMGKIEGMKGHVIRFPFRALSLADDFFRVLNDQGERYAVATQRAIEEGYNLQSREFRERVIDLVQNDAGIAEKGAKAAERFTFNTPLGEKGQAVQNMVHKLHLEPIVPFIRTPANVFKEMVRMTPIAPIIGEWREAYQAGGTERAKAVGEMAMGSAISAVVASMAMSGHISGQGSADPSKRAVAMSAGWQPYSIKIGDKWYSYQRLQPLGTLMGMAADLAEVKENLSDEEGNKAATMISVAFANAVTNQTFLAGITNILQVMADPNRYGSRFVQQYAGSVVPAAVAQSTQIYDPIQREVNGILDAVKARLPGLRQTLEPRIGPLTGEPEAATERAGIISPVTVGELSKDPVMKEALRLGIGAPKTPKNIQLPAFNDKQLGAVELTPQQRTLFAKTAGQLTHQIMSNVIQSGNWEGMPDMIKAEIFRRAISEGRRVANARAMPPEQRQQEMQRITDELQKRLATPPGT